MALENKDDKKIKNLLESNALMRAINVDFLQDLNNLNLIVKSSFKRAFNFLENSKESDKYDNWFYIAKLSPTNANISILGLVRMTLTSEKGYLQITHLEPNKVFKDISPENDILKYLKDYASFKALKGINILQDNEDPEETKRLSKIYENNLFKRKEGTLFFNWENS